MLREAAASQENVAAVIDFSGELARQIYAGADMFLMPSRYEPCGLGQMIALAYGTVPIVRATGGLDDSIQERGVRGSPQNGYKFEDYSTEGLLEAIAGGYQPGSGHLHQPPQSLAKDRQQRPELRFLLGPLCQEVPRTLPGSS